MGWTYIPGVPEEELYHHGILGQRWGRRRYQNPDGSYTQAGRARYGIFGSRKRKMSKDAKLRAKERARVKNEEARREAYTAEAERSRAQADAERAKTELREAKKQNSLAYKLGSKAAENAAYKAEQKRMAKEANKPLSKNASKYIEAIQSGNKRKIEKVARQLNNDEYRAAINRINMTYEMDRLKTEASITKGKQTIQRLTNAANMLSSGADVWNAGAGIISAFSGKNVPKINTKYTDPLDNIKKQLEVKSKEEALRTATAGANKAEELAIQERIKADTAKREWDDEEAKRKSEASRERSEKVVEAAKTYHKPTGANSRSFSGLTYKDKLAGKSLPEQQSSINLDSITVGAKKSAKKKVDNVFEQTKDIDLKSLMRRSKKSGYRTKDGNIDFSKLPEEEQEMWAQLIRGSKRGAKIFWNM